MTILVIGDANADLTALLPHFPHEGDDSTVSDLKWGSGGSAANTAVALARLGMPTRLLARVGNDPTAHIALRAAKQAGVDLRAIQVDNQHATGLCYAVISPSGERTFFAYRGANTMLLLPDPMATLVNVEWLHLGGHALIEGEQRNTTLRLIEAATHQHIPISLDLCLPLIRSNQAELLALVPKLQVLFGNEIELATLAQATNERNGSMPSVADPTDSVRNITNSVIVAKYGAAGCIINTGSMLAIPAFPVQVADTNGCGDAFVAGYLSAQLVGAAADICGLIGNACGALAASRPGAAEALPDLAALRLFVQSYPTANDVINRLDQQQGTVA